MFEISILAARTPGGIFVLSSKSGHRQQKKKPLMRLL